MASLLALLISLPECSGRRARLLPGLAGVPTEIVDAVRGTSLGEEELGRVVRSRYSPRVMRTLTLPEIGCSLSHIEALKTFLAGGYTHALILEDDAMIPEGALDALRAIVERHPSLDILKIGGFGPSTSRGLPIGQIGSVSVIQAITFGVCTHAYAVTRPAAERIIAAALPLREPFDTFLRNRHRHGCRIFETSPWLAGLQPAHTESTIGARPAERLPWPRLVEAAVVRCHAMLASRISNVGDFGPAALFAPARLPRFPSASSADPPARPDPEAAAPPT